MNQQYAVMWDCNGLEAVAAIPEPAETTFALLQNKEPPRTPNLMHWQLRARFNSQRHYEIYIFSVEPGIGSAEIRAMFENSPQQAADTVRRIGHCVYSVRAREKPVIT